MNGLRTPADDGSRNRSRPSVARSLVELLGVVLLRFRTLPRLWAIWLMLVNLGAVMFWNRLEAQVLLAAMMMGLTGMVLIYQRRGFIRLMGVGHAPWLVVLPWICLRFDSIPDDPVLYKRWLIVVLVTNSVSLLIDAQDLLRFLRGDRHPYYRFHSPAGDDVISRGSGAAGVTACRKANRQSDGRAHA